MKFRHSGAEIVVPPVDGPIRVTVLICTHNRWEALERTLAYLYATASHHVKLRVWDNASCDKTPDFLGLIGRWPNVTVVRSRLGVGTTGILRMMPSVDTPYVMTLSDDCVLPTEGWDHDLTSAMDAKTDLDAITLLPQHDFRNCLGPVPDATSSPYVLRSTPFIGLIKGHEKPGSPYCQPFLIESGGLWVRLNNTDPNYKPPPEAGYPDGLPLTIAATMWRTEAVRGFCELGYGILTDFALQWSRQIAARGHRWGFCSKHVVYNTLGPWWHMGTLEDYWNERAARAPLIYNTPSAELHLWMKRARETSGFNSLVGDADEVFPFSGNFTVDQEL